MTDRLDKDIHGVEAWAKISKERELAANAATLAAARALLAALEEADTLAQNLYELLREYAEDDNWAAVFLTQMEASGEHSRSAIKLAKDAGITTGEK